MQHMRLWSIFMLSAALTAASFSDPGGRFKLEVPSSWTQMPPGMLEAYGVEIRKWGAHGVNRDLVLGFVPNPKWKASRETAAEFLEEEGAAERQMILVQRGPKLRLLDGDFADPRFARRMVEAFTKARKLDDQANMLSGVRIQDNHYEAAPHLLWVKYEVPEPEGGVVSVLSGMYRTREGTLSINCYALGSISGPLESEFRGIIGSLKMEHALQYRPALMERVLPNASRTDQVVLAGGAALIVFGCALGLAVALGRRLFRRPKQEGMVTI
jgi:hypothetical protein